MIMLKQFFFFKFIFVFLLLYFSLMNQWEPLRFICIVHDMSKGGQTGQGQCLLVSADKGLRVFSISLSPGSWSQWACRQPLDSSTHFVSPFVSGLHPLLLRHCTVSLSSTGRSPVKFVCFKAHVREALRSMCRHMWVETRRFRHRQGGRYSCMLMQITWEHCCVYANRQYMLIVLIIRDTYTLKYKNVDMLQKWSILTSNTDTYPVIKCNFLLEIIKGMLTLSVCR